MLGLGMVCKEQSNGSFMFVVMFCTALVARGNRKMEAALVLQSEREMIVKGFCLLATEKVVYCHYRRQKSKLHALTQLFQRVPRE